MRTDRGLSPFAYATFPELTWMSNVYLPVLLLLLLHTTTGYAQATSSTDSTGQESSRTGRYSGRFPDDARRAVTAGTFEGAIAVPGTGVSFRIGGFIQTSASQDISGAISPGLFIPRLITNTDGPSRFVFTARNSRISVDARSESDGGTPIRAFIEMGFIGAPGNEGTTNADGLALRHAFAQIGEFYFGQYWSQLTDLESFPETTDAGAPAGKIFVRQPGIHYAPWIRGEEGKGIRLAVGLENSISDLTLLDRRGAPSPTLATIDAAPDALVYLRQEGRRGHLQLTGVLRYLGADSTQAVPAGGLSLTGSLDLPQFGVRDRLTFAASGGLGFGRYLVDLATAGYDAVRDPLTGELDLLRTAGTYLTYQHWWSETLRSTVAVGGVFVEASEALPAGAVHRAQSGVVNLFWSQSERATFGLEVLAARVVRRAGEGMTTADAYRANVFGQLNF